MKFTLIVAHDKNKAIGRNGDMPWHLPNDLKWFRKQTIHKIVLMGRATWEALPDNYKPLPNRTNLVLTTQKNYKAKGAVTCHSIADAITIANAKECNELMIVGGGQIYELFYPIADKLIITEVKTAVKDADTFFVEYDKTDWVKEFSESHQADTKHKFDYEFILYRKG